MANSLKSTFGNIDLLPSLKKDFNNKILQRSARELSQELVSDAIAKPIFTDNWDIVIEYDKQAFTDIVTSLAGTIGSAVGIIGNIGKTVTNLFNPAFAIQQNMTTGKLSANNLLNPNLASNASKIYQSTKNFIDNGTSLITALTDKIAMMKMSVRTTEISVPVLRAVQEFLKFGPLRYHYVVDYDYEKFSMTIIEDEETPLYPIFEKILNLGINFEKGTFQEASKSAVDISMTIYSDYTGFPFITYYLKGCHLNSIAIGGSGGQQSTFKRDKAEEVQALRYKLEFEVDAMKVAFNKLNPMVSLASRAVPINQFLSQANLNLFK